MTEKELLKIKKAAVAAAEEVGKIQMRYWRKKFSVHEKYKAGLVTEVDPRAKLSSKSASKSNSPTLLSWGKSQALRVMPMCPLGMWIHSMAPRTLCTVFLCFASLSASLSATSLSWA
jgi:hypothetical protein